MDKIIGITNAPDDVILANLSEESILVLAHGKYVGGHIVIYEDSQQIASGDLIDGEEVEGTGTYAYSLASVGGYSGYDDAKSYRLVIDGDEIDFVKNGILTNLPLDAMYIIADFGRGMQVTQTYPDLSSVSVSKTKTVTTKKYQTKKLDKSLLPDSVESGIKAVNAKANQAQTTADAAQAKADTAVRPTTPDNKTCWYSLSNKYDELAETNVLIGDLRWSALQIRVNRDMPSVEFIAPTYQGKYANFKFSNRPGTSINPLLTGLGGIILASSTSGSTKKFKLTVDDTGTLSATEVTDA